MPDVIGPEALIPFTIGVDEPEEFLGGKGHPSIRDEFPLHLTIGGEDFTYLLSESFTFSNVDPGGFEMASFPLPKDLPQIVRGMPVKLDCGLQVAWEGRVKEIQRSLGNKTLIQCEGYGARLKDTTMSEIFVDRDMTKWVGPSAARQVELDSSARTVDGQNVATAPEGSPALVASFTGDWSETGLPWCEAYYCAGGIPIGSVYYAWTHGTNVNPADTNWHWEVDLTNKEAGNTLGETTETGNLRGSGPGSGYLNAPSALRKYAHTSFQYSAAGGTAGTQYTLYWTTPAVYGYGFLASGPTKRGSAPGGFFPSEIAKYAMQQASGIEEGVFENAIGLIVPHAVYYTAVEIQQIISDMAKLVGWHWGVWESLTYLTGNPEPRLDFRAYPESATAFVWRKDCEAIDVREDLAGQYNKAQVQFTEAAGNEGVAEVTVDNPILDAADIGDRTLSLNLGVSEQAPAEDYGKLALEALQTQARVIGSATIKEPIHKMDGTSMAPWMLKAGLDRLRVPDLPSFDVWGEYSDLPISRVECTGSSEGITTSVEFGLGHNLMEALTAQLQQAAVLGGN